MNYRSSYRNEADDALVYEEDGFVSGQRESYQYDQQEMGYMSNQQQN